MKTNIIDTPQKVGEVVDVYGWVDTRRDHGKLIFIDLRDRSGKIQVVFVPGELHANADKLRSEWVIHVKGLIKSRPEKMINAQSPTGSIELEPQSLEIISEAQTLPFDIAGDGHDIKEEVRKPQNLFLNSF